MKSAPGSFSPSTLDARLVLYTTAGAGLLLASGAAEAQTVVYSGIRNITRSSGASYNLDVNGDLVNDFTLYSTAITSTGSSNSVSLDRPSSNRVVMSGLFAVPLTGGVSLSSATPGFSSRAAYLRKEPSSVDGEGLWPQGTERYLGLEFKIGAASHYGWARVSPLVNDNDSSFTLVDWAYNSTAGEAITTGDTGGASPSPVPEPSSLALFAAGGTAALGLLRRRRSVA